MTIDYIVGDYIRVNLAAVANNNYLPQTEASLGYLGNDPAQVLETGLTPSNLSYIKVLTTNRRSPAFQAGNGVILYFSSDTLLNDSFEASRTFLRDASIIPAYNNSGVTILKNSLIRQTGFDIIQQLPTISLANATSITTAIVLGVAAANIANGASGSILISGSYQADTTGFSLGAPVFLSNTPGAISSSAGIVSVIVGRVLNVALEGSISFSSQFLGGGGLDIGEHQITDFGGWAQDWPEGTPYSISGGLQLSFETGYVRYGEYEWSLEGSRSYTMQVPVGMQITWDYDGNYAGSISVWDPAGSGTFATMPMYIDANIIILSEFDSTTGASHERIRCDVGRVDIGPNPLAMGSACGTPDTVIEQSGYVDLTESVNTIVAEIQCWNSSRFGGRIDYLIAATDDTKHVSLTGSAKFSMCRTGSGVLTIVITKEAVEPLAASDGNTLAVTLTTADTNNTPYTGGVAIKMNATTDLAGFTSLYAKFKITLFHQFPAPAVILIPGAHGNAP